MTHAHPPTPDVAAYRAQRAPGGFAGRVVAEAELAQRPLLRLRRIPLAGAALAAMAAVAVLWFGPGTAPDPDRTILAWRFSASTPGPPEATPATVDLRVPLSVAMPRKPGSATRIDNGVGPELETPPERGEPPRFPGDS